MTVQRSCPGLGRTLRRWHEEIINWYRVRCDNGPTEANASNAPLAGSASGCAY